MEFDHIDTNNATGMLEHIGFPNVNLTFSGFISATYLY